MKIKDLLMKSLLKGGKPSSSRIIAANMQMLIFLFGLTAICIEITNAVIQWKQGQAHTIPWEHITILGMWLAHQLTLLGIYKSNETKISKIEDSINIKTKVNGEGQD